MIPNKRDFGKTMQNNNKLICCKQFPDDFCNFSIARSYFSQFGVVINIEICLEKMECIVEYITAVEGIRAVSNAGIYKGKEFHVEFKHNNFMQNKNSLNKVNHLEKELLRILKIKAKTMKDKFDILDARDQIIRMIIVGSTVDQKKIVGCCTDMCPEKERLRRQLENDISQFELSKELNFSHGNLLIDKTFMVKSYVPDKDPLPYDLRPEPVLNMTMMYLIHNIMDLGNDPETNLFEWYNFTCDRMHAIRQDIKSQGICTLNTIKIFEQCVRFHVHCAGHLICENPSVFDKYKNYDYLYECLDELNLMYKFLYAEENVISPRQSEFMNYMILLNLRNTNYECKFFGAPELKQSSLVKRAKAFKVAFKKKHYKKFFHLYHLRKTSYLSACILLGYFNEMRLFAIKQIIGNSRILSLEKITEDLSFETYNEAEEFVVANGFAYAFEDLILKSSNLNDISVKVSIPSQYINLERKLRVPASICIQGGETSGLDFDYYRPQSSFNIKGFLKLPKKNQPHLPFYESTLADKITNFIKTVSPPSLRQINKTAEDKEAAKREKSENKRIMRNMVLKKWEIKLMNDTSGRQY